MWLLILIGTLFGVDLLIHLYAELKLFQNKQQFLRARYLTKPFLIPLIILFYLVSGTMISGWLIAALIGGWVGDIMLMMPDPENTKKFFKIGLIAFLLGHIFYIISFLTFLESFAVIPWWIFLINVLLILYGILIAKILLPHVGSLKIPIIIYIVIIICMAISASWLLNVDNLLGYLILTLGTISFVISDTINAYNRFVKPIAYERLVTMSTYALGQFLIIYGVILAI